MGQAGLSATAVGVACEDDVFDAEMGDGVCED